MRQNAIFYKPFEWIAVLAVLSGGLLLAGCDRSTQSQPARPVPEVATVTLQHQKVMLATELPGRTAAFRVAEIRPQV
ncbi:MAG: efflux transporter periplasmic adaptor subunit, partial [Desulfobacteraceae bacterium]|nr:efflux transporter periplasmic adaptor subunit [Desulfobacteraceae bacterium]